MKKLLTAAALVMALSTSSFIIGCTFGDYPDWACEAMDPQ